MIVFTWLLYFLLNANETTDNQQQHTHDTAQQPRFV